jgi:tetratricopeptide (TPR) repeat protein
MLVPRQSENEMRYAPEGYVRALTVLATALLAACASSSPGGSPIVYRPGPGLVRSANISETRAYVESGLRSAKAYEPRTRTWVGMEGARITPTHLTVAVNGTNKSIALSDMSVQGHGVIGETGSVSIEGGGYYKATRPDLYLLAELPATATKSVQQMVDALAVLQLAALDAEREDDARFEQVARVYREAATKPALPEDARRFKVQADGAIRDSNFVAAVGLFDEALEVAPWWPTGYFNRALVLGETENYKLAMSSMKRWIALEPGAPDTRAAQDRIYEWERKLLNEQQYAMTAPGAAPSSTHPAKVIQSHSGRNALLVIFLSLAIGGAAVAYGASTAQQ